MKGRERAASAAARNPLDRQGDVVDRRVGIARRVLDRPSHKTDLAGHADGLRADLGRGAEPVLEIGRDRQIRRVDDLGGILEISALPILAKESRLPLEKAYPALVVASASNPRLAKSRADPASHGLGMTNAPGR